MKTMSKLFTTAATCAVLATSQTAIADTVTLTSLTSSASLTGELLKYENNYFTLGTSIGEVQISADLVACEGAACPGAQITVEAAIAGDRMLMDMLIPNLIKAYSDSVESGFERTGSQFELTSNEHGISNLTLKPVDSAEAIKAMINGQATFAMTSRRPTNAELRAANVAGLGDLLAADREHVVGYDGLLLVANQNSHMRAVSEKVAAQIFAGQITNWSQLGGPDADINVYATKIGTGARSLFDELLMRSNRLSIADRVTELDDDGMVAAAVASDPYGFGFTSTVYASNEVKSLDIQGVCGLRTKATAFSIKTGEYPLTRPLYLYTNGEALEGQLQEFIEFIATPDAQEMVSASGFVGQTISEEELNDQGIRVASTLLLQQDDIQEIGSIRNMLGMLLASERLSTTVRFSQGGNELDSTAQADVKRLAEKLTAAEFSGKQFYFMGFSDSVGRSDLNQLLALQRAELVRSELLKAMPELKDRIKARSVGFGEISPLGCNETRTGRSINRRVEIWMQDIATDNKV